MKFIAGTITALVGIHVLNKTTEEYWFLMKINITVEGDSVGDMGGVKSGIMDFFLVKLKVNPGYVIKMWVSGRKSTFSKKEI